MTPSFLVAPTGARSSRKRGIKEMAVFGLRKAFIDPVSPPRVPTGRMERFFGDAALANDFWIPE